MQKLKLLHNRGVKSPTENVQQFQSQLYACFPKRAAAAFNLIDALASAEQVESPIELSQSPAFERKYASVPPVGLDCLF